jgi:type III secretion protein C
VRDTPQRMHLYERLIAQLDVETPLVEIEAAIIDVAHDKTEELGVDWRLQLSTHVDIRSTQQEPPQRGGLATLIIGSQRNHLMARVNALAERGDARLISRPRVLTLDNLEAVLQSTREFYVRVAGREQVDLFNVSTGLTMRVTPTFVEEETAGGGKRFRLVVRIEDGNTAGTEVDRIPVVNRNAISTQAVVGDGQSLLIGGYEVEETRDGKSGVPVLSELPGVGWLFGRRSSGSRKVERMFMITPRLVNVAAAPAPAAPAVAPPAAPAKPAVSAMPAPAAVAPVVAAPVVPVAVPPATPAAAAIVARPDERAAVVVRERVAPAKEAASVPPPQMPADVSPPPAQPGREPVREPVREPAREPVATAVALAAVPATLPVSKPGTPAGLRSGSRVDLVEVMNALGLKVPSR